MKGVKNALMGIYLMLAAMPVSAKGRPTRIFSSGMTTLALAAVVLMVAAGGASADNCGAGTGRDCQCGDTVVGDWTFTGNMNCANNGVDGLTIGASDITIDGADFTMTGSKDSTICNLDWPGEYTLAHHCGIRNDGYNNVTIKNLVVTNFCTGIGLRDSGTGDMNNTIEHCTIHDNGINGGEDDGYINHGFHLIYAEYCNIRYNNISNNRGSGWGCGDGGNGIFIIAGGGYNEITHNEIINNTKSGIFTKMKSQHNHIAHNNITGPRHEEGGITLMCKQSSYNLIEWNNVSGNAGWGIELGGYWNNVNNNTIEDNGWMGLYMDRCPTGTGGSHNNTIFNNSICRNGFDASVSEWRYGSGVWITPWCNPLLNTKLYNNTICDNRDKDIYNGDPSSTIGDWNTCDTATDYCDDSADCPPPCVWQCLDSGPDLVIRDLDAYWVNSYNVSFTVYNQGVENAGASTTSVKIVNRNDGTVHEATYPIPALNIGTGHPIEIGPFNIADDEPHTIVVVADSNNDVIERPINERNNCSTDVFGAPDLIIIGFPEEDWVDASMKQFNLTYTVKNVGDANITAGQSFSVCVMQSPDGPWGPCCEVVQGPLNVSDSYTGTIGPITADTGNEKVKVYADYYEVIRENDERCESASCPTDNCDYRHVVYPGPCLGCGDVDCGGVAEMADYDDLHDYVSNVPGATLSCKWAGDVDCSGIAEMADYDDLHDYVSNVPGATLSCCPGGC